jgi:hypothetical protein
MKSNVSRRMHAFATFDVVYPASLFKSSDSSPTAHWWAASLIPDYIAMNMHIDYNLLLLWGILSSSNLSKEDWDRVDLAVLCSGSHDFGYH